MRTLIFGSTGMLGQALTEKFKFESHQVIGFASKNADISFDIRDEMSILKACRKYSPNVIINCVAKTVLNDCENDPADAYMVNTRPVFSMIKYVSESKCRFIQISTDHFFRGDKDLKHDESCEVTILNEYARTKYLAEQIALQYDNSLVIRTNIIGFRNWINNPTFVEWVRNQLLAEKEIRAFKDYYTSSITVYQFADVLSKILKIGLKGLINVGSRDVFSKKEIITSLAEKWGFSNPKIVDATIFEQMSISRCESLGLDVDKIQSVLGIQMPSFEEVVLDIIKRSNSI